MIFETEKEAIEWLRQIKAQIVPSENGLYFILEQQHITLNENEGMETIIFRAINMLAERLAVKSISITTEDEDIPTKHVYENADDVIKIMKSYPSLSLLVQEDRQSCVLGTFDRYRGPTSKACVLWGVLKFLIEEKQIALDDDSMAIEAGLTVYKLRPYK